MLNQNQRDAIYDAVAAHTGLPGVWEKQKGAPALKGPHFSLNIMFPPQPTQRRASSLKPSIYPEERRKKIIRKRFVLQVKVFDAPEQSSAVTDAVDSERFTYALTDAGVVAHGINFVSDLSFAFPEYINVHSTEIEMSFVTYINTQDEEPTEDIFVEKVDIIGEIGGITTETNIDVSED